MAQDNSVTAAVAVIIPTYNDVKRLKTCLDALAEQSFSGGQLRVFVVDNNSTDDIEGLCVQYPFCHYLYEPTSGAYHARNKGLSALTDEAYVGFTDSDCIPDPQWVANAVAALAEQPNKAVGGHVGVFAVSDVPSSFEWYEILFAFPQQIYIERNQFAVTANLFLTREMVDSVGPFNSSVFSGGDADYGVRIHQAGFSMRFVEGVIVGHPARKDFKQFKTKIDRTIGGIYQQRKSNPHMAKALSWPALLRGFLPPLVALKQLAVTKAGMTLTDKLKVAWLLFYIKYLRSTLLVMFKLKLIDKYERF